MGFAGLALPWKITVARQPATEEHCLPGIDARDDSAAQSLASSLRASDAALVAACRRGHVGAYEELYQMHGAKLKSLAMNLLGNRSDAEDAVQETFLKIHRGIGNFKGESSFSTWGLPDSGELLPRHAPKENAASGIVERRSADGCGL